MSARGSVLGWIVLRRDTEQRRWCPDFDGEVHTSRPRADEALNMAVDAGHQAVLAEVTWIQPPPAGSVPIDRLVINGKDLSPSWMRP